MNNLVRQQVRASSFDLEVRRQVQDFGFKVWDLRFFGGVRLLGLGFRL